MKIGIIGCGNVGKKRASTLGINELVAVADVSLDNAKDVASVCGCESYSTDYRSVIEREDIDLVIISTTNQFLSTIAYESVLSGKHVLVEKPAGRNSAELIPIIECAKKKGIFVKVGFNHRYHPALLKAKEMVTSGTIGDIMFIRGRYGHGGRTGYDTEWRSDPEKAGGGELIDQGVHLIDLSRWFLGDLSVDYGFASTFFWNMSVDDNAFFMLKNDKKQVAWLHVSSSEWKNTFSFEIYGIHGKLQVDGLGGSYGVEKLIYYQMLPSMGPPATTIWEYPFPDLSWQMELEYFIHTILKNETPEADIVDAKAALDIVQDIYNFKKIEMSS
jgi:predicted dehydrogenase